MIDTTGGRNAKQMLQPLSSNFTQGRSYQIDSRPVVKATMPVTAALKTTTTAEVSSVTEKASVTRAPTLEAPPRSEVEDKEHHEVEEEEEALPKAKVKTIFNPHKVVNN